MTARGWSVEAGWVPGEERWARGAVRAPFCLALSIAVALSGGFYTRSGLWVVCVFHREVNSMLQYPGSLSKILIITLVAEIHGV